MTILAMLKIRFLHMQLPVYLIAGFVEGLRHDSAEVHEQTFYWVARAALDYHRCAHSGAPMEASPTV